MSKNDDLNIQSYFKSNGKIKNIRYEVYTSKNSNDPIARLRASHTIESDDGQKKRKSKSIPLKNSIGLYRDEFRKAVDWKIAKVRDEYGLNDDDKGLIELKSKMLEAICNYENDFKQAKKINIPKDPLSEHFKKCGKVVGLTIQLKLDKRDGSTRPIFVSEYNKDKEQVSCLNKSLKQVFENRVQWRIGQVKEKYSLGSTKEDRLFLRELKGKMLATFPLYARDYESKTGKRVVLSDDDLDYSEAFEKTPCDKDDVSVEEFKTGLEDSIKDFFENN